MYLLGRDGVFASTDADSTWSMTSWPMNADTPTLVVVDPTDAQRVYVGTQNPPGVWVSTDAGGTWTERTVPGSGSPQTLSVDPADPSVMVVGMNTTPAQGGGVFVSSDGGARWRPANRGLASGAPYTGAYAWAVQFEPASSGVPEVALATEFGCYLSRDLGSAWSNITGSAVPRLFTGLAWAGSTLYAATYGEGVLRMQNP